MTELEYLDHPPAMVRVEAQSLKVGMRHVTRLASGKYEVARIRAVHPTSNGSRRIDLGPEGHANRTMALAAKADIAVVVVDQVVLLACPECHHEDSEIDGVQHGVSFFQCAKCGFKGPEVLSPREEKEKQPVLAAMARAWNSVPR